MSNSEEVFKIGKKLDKMVSSDTTDDTVATDLLSTLKKFPMTFELLQKSRIGMKVNNFRKACNNESLVSLSKSLIKTWKKLLPDSSGGSQSNSKSTLQRSNSSGSLSAPKDEDSRDSSGNSDNQKPETPTSPSADRPSFARQSSFPINADDTADSVRLKCRELLGNSLKTQPEVENAQDPDELAAGIEDCIFKEFKGTSIKYKTRVRSRVANLRDTKNPALRENVLLGIIPPDRIACMTAEEMASDDLKEMRGKFTKEAINDHQMSIQSGSETSIFKCGRCNQRKCTYNQVQTRSADEPMTTFVFCNNCGNRWKFC